MSQTAWRNYCAGKEVISFADFGSASKINLEKKWRNLIALRGKWNGYQQFALQQYLSRRILLPDLPRNRIGLCGSELQINTITDEVTLTHYPLDKFG